MSHPFLVARSCHSSARLASCWSLQRSIRPLRRTRLACTVSQTTMRQGESVETNIRESRCHLRLFEVPARFLPGVAMSLLRFRSSHHLTDRPGMSLAPSQPSSGRLKRQVNGWTAPIKTRKGSCATHSSTDCYTVHSLTPRACTVTILSMRQTKVFS
eukprot:m.38405 g.38405  ORF g.38405 m.38405 type:complete len:157 (+) comp32578_c0_seq2:101-571(+)